MNNLYELFDMSLSQAITFSILFFFFFLLMARLHIHLITALCYVFVIVLSLNVWTFFENDISRIMNVFMNAHLTNYVTKLLTKIISEILYHHPPKESYSTITPKSAINFVKHLNLKGTITWLLKPVCLYTTYLGKVLNRVITYFTQLDVIKKNRFVQSSINPCFAMDYGI